MIEFYFVAPECAKGKRYVQLFKDINIAAIRGAKAYGCNSLWEADLVLYKIKLDQYPLLGSFSLVDINLAIKQWKNLKNTKSASLVGIG